MRGRSRQQRREVKNRVKHQFDGDAGPGGGGSDEFIDAAVCSQSAPIPVTTTVATPDMLLVVDKSGSMGEPLDGGGGAKWTVMRNALDMIVPAEQANIHFGLMLFPSDDTCGAGVVTVPIAPMNATAIVAGLAPIQPNGATPTYTSVAAAGQYYATIPVNPDGQYVLLATDGQPNCAGNGADPSGPTITQSIQAVQALHAAGIKTFVIGFGGTVTADPSTLMAMAAAGGTTTYYPANSPADLQTALMAISGTVTQASCTFTLATTVADPGKLTVTLDGVVVPRDPGHSSGWDYDPATNTITFYGGTCDTVQTGTGHDVGVDYGCGGPVIE